MSDSDGLDGSLPPGWKVDYLGTRSASFENEARGLEVRIRAVHKKNARKRNTEPTHYTIQLVQDWFATGTLGKRNMAAKVQTSDEAKAVAQEFMREFSRELDELPGDHIQATHASVGDHDAADDIITAEVSAEALADAAGYSDELLLSVLAAETNGQYRRVVHRTGSTITTVAGDETVAEDETAVLRALYGSFPIDRTGIAHILNEQPPFAIVTHLRDFVIYRFIFDKSRETNIILAQGTEVRSPEFERTIINVLEEKW